MGENAKISTCSPTVSTGFLAYAKSLVMMVRAAHWAKNLFLFIPLFFAGDLFKMDKLLQVSLGVVAFSLVASSIYILNDIKDLENDRLHPVKRNRSIASGKVSLSVALIVMVFCVTSGLLIGWY